MYFLCHKFLYFVMFFVWFLMFLWFIFLLIKFVFLLLELLKSSNLLFLFIINEENKLVWEWNELFDGSFLSEIISLLLFMISI